MSTKLVPYINLAGPEAGLGRTGVCAPRLPLTNWERARMLKIIRDSIACRPTLPAGE